MIPEITLAGGNHVNTKKYGHWPQVIHEQPSLLGSVALAWVFGFWQWGGWAASVTDKIDD